jgi:hypothetical protein
MNRRAISAHGRSVLQILLLLTLEIGDEETGLSKGPADPADTGSRCAVMAGRDDRAYLHCAEHARRRAVSTDETGGTPSDRSRPDHSGGSHGGATRRYLPRGR